MASKPLSLATTSVLGQPPGESDAAMQYWNSIADTIADGPPQTVWRRHSDAVNKKLLAQWLPKDRCQGVLKTDLFDEALGEGLCAFLSNCSDELHGVDLSEAIIDAAGKRYPALHTKRADVRALPFPDQRFDCIVSNSTLDHFPTSDDIDTGLGELYRVLRKGGELIITLDNLQHPLIWLRSVLPYRLLQRTGLAPYYVGATLTT